MTWRAFVIGIVAVAVLSAVTPYNDFGRGNTLLTGNHFPVGAFFVLVLLTFGVNLLLKLIRRAWAFRRSELMWVWCMMTVAATVPSSGLMRNYFPVVAAPAYYANRADFRWKETVVPAAPPALVLSKDLHSPAVYTFFEGTGGSGETRIPWRQWARPTVSWGIFVALFYMATLCMCGLLRKQWVESERLMFPLARVPLELAEGSASTQILPNILRSKAFWVAVAAMAAIDSLRVLPILMGKDSGVSLTLPLNRLLAGSDLRYASFGDAPLYPMAVGFAFLLPAHISFSIWLFRILTRFEFLTNYWLGLPHIHDYVPFTAWQQAGAFIAFTAGMLWMTRRHLYTVFSKAVGLDRTVDDSSEPIGYRTSFWGLVLSFVGMVAWSWYFEMSPAIAAVVIALMFCVLLIHTRVVCQGGLFFTGHAWNVPNFVHGLTGAYAFSAPAAVVAQMQSAIFMGGVREALSPYAMNALRISSVFGRKRRWFLPVMLLTLLVAIIFAGWSSMLVNYHYGAYNIYNNWGSTALPKATFNRAERMILNPEGSVERSFPGLAAGMGTMGALLLLQSRLHWWPIHPIGFLMPIGYVMRVMWLSFFLGWLIKSCILRFGGGRMLRSGRNFFLGVIVTEAFVVGLCAVVGLVSEYRFGFLFMPL